MAHAWLLSKALSEVNILHFVWISSLGSCIMHMKFMGHLNMPRRVQTGVFLWVLSSSCPKCHLQENTKRCTLQGPQLKRWSILFLWLGGWKNIKVKVLQSKKILGNYMTSHEKRINQRKTLKQEISNDMKDKMILFQEQWTSVTAFLRTDIWWCFGN